MAGHCHAVLTDERGQDKLYGDISLKMMHVYEHRSASIAVKHQAPHALFCLIN
jgi:hypothetical protein